MFWAIIISLTIRDLYSHQHETDYLLCQITTLQQLDIMHLAEEANIKIHARELPPCVKPLEFT